MNEFAGLLSKPEIASFITLLQQCELINELEEYDEDEFYRRRRKIDEDIAANDRRMDEYRRQLLEDRDTLYSVKNGKYTCLILNDEEETCDIVYSSLECMKRHHHSTHFNISFICVVCGAGFKRKDKMNAHKLHHVEPVNFFALVGKSVKKVKFVDSYYLRK